MDRVVTVTVNPSLDTTATARRVEPDRKIRCVDSRRDPGGGGINAARAVGILGGEVIAVWTKGGVFGTALGALLDAEGIGHEPVEIDGETRESFAVIEQDSERHYRFSIPGPRLESEILEGIVAAVMRRAPRYLVLSGGLPPGVPQSFYARLAAVGAEAGSDVVLDAHGEALAAALAGGNVTLVKPNYRELLRACGHDADEDEPEVAEVARDLIADTGTEAVLVSLGAAGAVLVTAERVDRIPAPTVPIRSRIGAGDSMVGALVWSLARGDELADAARWAVAAGTAAVTTPGTELCRRADVERLRAGMNPDQS